MYRNILILLLIAFSNFSLAQVRISGKIIDEGSNDPLAGVNIKIKDKFVGTVSNPQGEFNFETNEPLPFSIEVSMVGYKMQTITIDKQVTVLDL